MKQKPYARDKILVVGTTSDYIDWIQTSRPGQALFLTDPEIRKNALEPCPEAGDEITVRLEMIEAVKCELKTHLKRWNQTVTGITCFDCESMETASMLAAELGVEYPDLESIQNCRDKYVSKKIWQQNGVLCPAVLPVNSVEEVKEFFKECDRGIVLKPFYGSGSELVFRCRTQEECVQAFDTIKKGLERRCGNPLFKRNDRLTHRMVAEEYLSGPEYSCDFILENNQVGIIRTSRKIKSSDRPFGTVTGYILPALLPDYVSISALESALLDAAQALGLKRAICMVDFILADDSFALIEMTPRPGGDCLPFLIREAGDLDILGLALDFAGKKKLSINMPVPFKTHIGLRVHAQKEGVFAGFDASLLTDDKRVKQIHMIRQAGHKITMPPEDYDSWLLGHIIIEPDENNYMETRCLMIQKRLKLEIQE